LLYSIAFILIARSHPALGGFLSALFLLVGGLLASAALTAVYLRVREVESGFAMWGTFLSLAALFGSAVHGAYDLANSLHPPSSDLSSLASLPSPIDPRGLLTFGIAGVGLFILSRLMGRQGSFPKPLSTLGLISAGLLVLIYLARLILLDATNPVLVVLVLVEGFLVNPAWYIWLGVSLQRG